MIYQGLVVHGANCQLSPALMRLLTNFSVFSGNYPFFWTSDIYIYIIIDIFPSDIHAKTLYKKKSSIHKISMEFLHLHKELYNKITEDKDEIKSNNTTIFNIYIIYSDKNKAELKY